MEEEEQDILDAYPIKKYFTPYQYKHLSQEDRRRYAKMRQEYEVLSAHGMQVALPDFMKIKLKYDLEEGATRPQTRQSTSKEKISIGQLAHDTSLESTSEKISTAMTENGGSTVVKNIKNSVSGLQPFRLVGFLFDPKSFSNNASSAELETNAAQLEKKISMACIQKETAEPVDDVIAAPTLNLKKKLAQLLCEAKVVEKKQELSSQSFDLMEIDKDIEDHGTELSTNGQAVDRREEVQLRNVDSEGASQYEIEGVSDDDDDDDDDDESVELGSSSHALTDKDIFDDESMEIEVEEALIGEMGSEKRDDEDEDNDCGVSGITEREDMALGTGVSEQSSGNDENDTSNKCEEREVRLNNEGKKRSSDDGVHTDRIQLGKRVSQQSIGIDENDSNECEDREVRLNDKGNKRGCSDDDVCIEKIQLGKGVSEKSVGNDENEGNEFEKREVWLNNEGNKRSSDDGVHTDRIQLGKGVSQQSIGNDENDSNECEERERRLNDKGNKRGSSDDDVDIDKIQLGKVVTESKTDSDEDSCEMSDKGVNEDSCDSKEEEDDDDEGEEEDVVVVVVGAEQEDDEETEEVVGHVAVKERKEDKTKLLSGIKAEKARREMMNKLRKARRVQAAKHIQRLQERVPPPPLKPTQVFPCGICGFIFKRSSHLHRHRISNMGKDGLMCNVRKGKTTEFRCDDCGQVFKRKYNLNRHVDQKHSKIDVNEKIEMETEVMSSQVDEVLSLNEESFSCDKCENVFNSKCDYNIHVRKFHSKDGDNGTETAEEILSLPMSHDVGNTTTKFSATSLKPPENVKEFECDKCGKVFNRSNNLKRHKMVHTDERPFKCVVCGKGFKQPNHLVEHERLHTDEKLFKCPTCQMRFSRQRQMVSHQKIHSKEKLYKCDICEKCFARSDYLLCHKRTHEREKILKCDVCHRDFKTEPALISHKWSHLREKVEKIPKKMEAVKCGICGKDFPNAVALEGHKKIHNKTQAMCNICGKMFSHNTYLMSHKRCHKVKLKCDICGKEYAKPKSLQGHRKLHEDGMKKQRKSDESEGESENVGVSNIRRKMRRSK